MDAAMDPGAVLKNAEYWCQHDPNNVTKAHVKNLLLEQKNNNTESSIIKKQLMELFPPSDKRISFGTAGLRSAMKPGPLGMNDLTVVQTAQGLAKYCIKKNEQQSTKLCAVVGYDHRANTTLQLSSLSFALFTALVFKEAGIDCILMDGLIFTPLVPFALQRHNAAVGIMITASHNPKNDAGYKVYASDGCQIRAPMDKQIANEILNNLTPWTDYGAILEERRKLYPNDPCLGLSQPDVTQQIVKEYFDAVKSSGLYTGQAKLENLPNSLPTPKFAYTAMHGVGYKFATKIFEVFGLPSFLAVPAQRDADPSFPTVPFPNPEEKGALSISKSFAEENGCDIVLANDPDADRLAVAERDRDTGEWTVFTGDQIGVMLGLWMWEQIGKDCGKPVAMCASTVSSKMLAEIARVEGFHFEDTLTGFKWIGSRCATLSRSEGYRTLFGYEEAIGFCCGDVIFDKDGISGMSVFAELALWTYRNGKSLKTHLQSLYDRYGEFVSNNGYYFLNDPQVVHIIMDRIRANGLYDIDLSPYKLEAIRDLGEPGYDSSRPDKKPTLPTSKSSPMLTLKFTNGCVVQLRGSGTEPKLKYYIEKKGEPGVSRDIVKKELDTMVPIILETLLEPKKNGLVAP